MSKEIKETKNVEKIKVEEVAEQEAEVTTAVEVVEKQEVKNNKFVAGVKKHGKKIAVGALALISGTVVVCKLLSGRNSEAYETEEYDEVDEVEIKEF